MRSPSGSPRRRRDENPARRRIVAAAGLLPFAALAGCATSRVNASRASIVVVGGGYGGATAASMRRCGAARCDVTLVEPEAGFVSCPMSNLVLGGSKALADITRAYARARERTACAWFTTRGAHRSERRRVLPRAGGELGYDRLILSPGVESCRRRRRTGRRGSAAPHPARLEGGRADRWRCAASSKRCPTAACSRSPFPARRTAVRPGPTSAPARRRGTSSGEAAQQGADPRRQRGRQSKGALFTKAWAEELQGHRRVSARLRADRCRRDDEDRSDSNSATR